MSKQKNGQTVSFAVGRSACIRGLRELWESPDPIMLRRRCDLSVSCCRKHAEGKPTEIRLQGESEYPLIRALAVGAAAAAGICLAVKCGRMLAEARCRRKLRKTIGEQYRIREEKRRAKDAGRTGAACADPAQTQCGFFDRVLGTAGKKPRKL